MKLLTESDLLLAGWLRGPQFAQLMQAVTAMEARGIRDPHYAIERYSP